MLRNCSIPLLLIRLIVVGTLMGQGALWLCCSHYCFWEDDKLVGRRTGYLERLVLVFDMPEKALRHAKHAMVLLWSVGSLVKHK